jgi:hypothetical protein
VAVAAGAAAVLAVFLQVRRAEQAAADVARAVPAPFRQSSR